MKRRKSNGPIRITAADLKKYPQLAAKLGITAEEIESKKSRVKSEKPKPTKAPPAERRYEVSWYAPQLGRRVTYDRTVRADTKEGAIREVRAWLRSMSFREHKGAANLMARQVNSNQRTATSRQKTARNKNLFGLGKKAKAKRRRKLRTKADILSAKAALLRARSKNSANSKQRAASSRKKNKPITMTYALAMAAGHDAADRQMKKAGRKKWNRADHNKAVAVFEKLYGQQARARNPRLPNPPIWADILGGLAGGAGYAVAATWAGEKLKKKKKPERAENKGRRRNHTASTARLFREFHGHNPSGKVLNLLTPPGTPKDVSLDGPIMEIRLENGKSVKFAASDRAALHRPKAFMGHAQRGASKRIYVGLIEPYGRRENGEPINRSTNYGEIKEIAYWCAKPHLTGHNRSVPWEHKFGDRGGRKPNLFLLPNGCIDIRGGDYTVVSGGIDN
jgi:hypothetical protein